MQGLFDSLSARRTIVLRALFFETQSAISGTFANLQLAGTAEHAISSRLFRSSPPPAAGPSALLKETLPAARRAESRCCRPDRE